MYRFLSQTKSIHMRMALKLVYNAATYLTPSSTYIDSTKETKRSLVVRSTMRDVEACRDITGMQQKIETRF